MITYSEPQLCTYEGDLTKSWFVYFEVSNGTQTARKQFRGGINYLQTVKDRTKEGELLRQFWSKNLKDGWSPFEKSLPKDLLNLSFEQAIQFALDKCEVSTKTKSCYKTTVKFIKKASRKLILNNTRITAIKRQHVKLLMEEIKKDRKLSNHGYNKHLGYLCSILSRLEDWEILEHNPAKGIKSLKTVETQKYIPYTPEEKKVISEYLYMNHYNYFVFLMVVYHAGIRPKEVLSLKIKDVDFAGQTIKIYPDLEKENSKTSNIRIVPINNQLLPFLRELQLSTYPSDYFVFGSPYPRGLGNRGSLPGGKRGYFHPDYCKPSLTPIKRDTLTRLWKEIVKDKLKIDKYQYAMKHTGADDKILAGIDLDALRELYGHSSKFMTEKYARVVKEVYKKAITELSPAF